MLDYNMEERQIYLDLDKDTIYCSDNCQYLMNAWEAGEITMQAWARLGYPGKRIREGVLPGINTIGYWNAKTRQNWGLDWHRNEGIEITFLESGKLPFALEDSQHVVMPNELTITRPWQLHRLGDPAIGVGKLFWILVDVGVRQPHQEWKWPSWVLLSKKDLKELTLMLRQSEQPILQTNLEIRWCFQKLGSLVGKELTTINETRIHIYLNELLINILEIYRRGSFPTNAALTEKVRTVELFIKELNNSFSEPWTLESMASHCGLGITRFVYYFKQCINRTPVQHLTILRLEASLKLLAEGMSITDICYECGFSRTQYFATVFKQLYGCSPTAYRIKKGFS